MLRSKFTDRCYLKELIEIYKLLIKPAEVTMYLYNTDWINSFPNNISSTCYIKQKKCPIIIYRSPNVVSWIATISISNSPILMHSIKILV